MTYDEDTLSVVVRWEGGPAYQAIDAREVRMRSEHRTTGDEWDLQARKYYAYLSRAGGAKAVKVASHRRDRRVAKRDAISDQMMEVDDVGSA